MAVLGSDPTFTVSDFVAIFNQSLDVMYPSVAIVGELSNFRISKGTWVYFDLKDETASVRFFGTTRSLPGPLEDGMTLEVFGRPYLHPKFGFSIQISDVQVSGVGSIKKAHDLLAAKLEKEGLFDPARKRTLPFPPERIGLITSSESAAYTDFDKIITARWPGLDIELYDVQVQGESASAQIVAAIEAANQKADQLEALIIIRGGGSRDDLVAFDHELVVRAVAASRIPTMVAIGHERDVVLAELAADVRASTPSNAAELLVPDRVNEVATLRAIKGQLARMVETHISDQRREVRVLTDRLEDLVATRLQEAVQYARISRQLVSALDPKQPLKRGYVLVRTAEGQIIRTAKAAKQQVIIGIEFGDGTLNAKPLK